MAGTAGASSEVLRALWCRTESGAPHPLGLELVAEPSIRAMVDRVGFVYDGWNFVMSVRPLTSMISKITPLRLCYIVGILAWITLLLYDRDYKMLGVTLVVIAVVIAGRRFAPTFFN